MGSCDLQIYYQWMFHSTIGTCLVAMSFTGVLFASGPSISQEMHSVLFTALTHSIPFILSILVLTFNPSHYVDNGKMGSCDLRIYYQWMFRSTIGDCLVAMTGTASRALVMYLDPPSHKRCAPCGAVHNASGHSSCQFY